MGKDFVLLIDRDIKFWHRGLQWSAQSRRTSMVARKVESGFVQGKQQVRAGAVTFPTAHLSKADWCITFGCMICWLASKLLIYRRGWIIHPRREAHLSENDGALSHGIRYSIFSSNSNSLPSYIVHTGQGCHFRPRICVIWKVDSSMFTSSNLPCLKFGSGTDGLEQAHFLTPRCSCFKRVRRTLSMAFCHVQHDRIWMWLSSLSHTIVYCIRSLICYSMRWDLSRLASYIVSRIFLGQSSSYGRTGLVNRSGRMFAETSSVQKSRIVRS